MKNQFFADRRDFFKYDLLLELLEGGQLSGLTLVPMLTPDDGGPDGRFTRYRCGNRRAGLYKFLLQPPGLAPAVKRYLTRVVFVRAQNVLRVLTCALPEPTPPGVSAVLRYGVQVRLKTGMYIMTSSRVMPPLAFKSSRGS